MISSDSALASRGLLGCRLADKAFSTDTRLQKKFSQLFRTCGVLRSLGLGDSFFLLFGELLCACAIKW